MSSALKTHPLLWKLPVLALFFFTVVLAASVNLFPQVSPTAAVIYAAAGGVAFLALISVGIMIASRVNTYVLNKGGTDTQRLWFKSEPRGLVRLREEARMKSDGALQAPEPNGRDRGP